MKPQKQLKLHDPERGILGSCWAACIAMVLDLDAAQVPNFIEEDNWFMATVRWLRERGYSLVEIPESQTFVCAPGTPFIVNGIGPRGVRHSIVRMLHEDGRSEDFDPHPSDDGLLEVESFTLVTARGAVGDTRPMKWTEEKAHRRIDLIELDMKQGLSPEERAELDRLTAELSATQTAALERDTKPTKWDELRG